MNPKCSAAPPHNPLKSKSNYFLALPLAAHRRALGTWGARGADAGEGRGEGGGKVFRWQGIQRSIYIHFFAVALSFISQTIVHTTETTPFPATTEFEDRHGLPLRSFERGELCLPVKLNDVSPWVILCTLAAEDKRFWDHHGVDGQAVLRALWQNTQSGKVVSGGSTLTQQLVRQLEPRPKGLWGKAEEAWKALRMERKSSKSEILEQYLNSVFYGNGARGIEAASHVYFNLPCHDLSLAQSALLAGLPKSPSGYNPFRNKDAAVARQHVVLDRLKRWGWVDEPTAHRARSEPLSFSNRTHPFFAPHFTDRLRNAVGQGRHRTTLDRGLQAELEDLLPHALERLKPQDVSNGALLVLDNATGDILAWVGSKDYLDEVEGGQVDGVTALRQPGSAVKPFLYELAFEGDVRPGDKIEDTPLYTAGRYAPRNYDNTFHGRVSLREALANSYNIPAVRLIEKVGIDPFLKRLRATGLQSLIGTADHYGLGLALGNAEVTLLELTSAYSILARGGVWKPTRSLSIDPTPPGVRVSQPAATYLVTHVLSDNSARAHAFGLNSPFRMPFPFAAKTGTTKDYHDNWAIGYTPRWTIGVWVGNFDGRPMRRVSGVTGAGPLLHDAAMAVYSRYPSGEFTRPREITEGEVCPTSGCSLSLDCPNAMVEVYSKRFPPPGPCGAHDPVIEKKLSGFRLVFPRQGDIFKMDPAIERSAQSIRFQTEGEVPDVLQWRVDGRDLPQGKEAWWALSPGDHRAEVTAHFGDKTMTRSTFFRVLP